jgi:hypothetical protein
VCLLETASVLGHVGSTRLEWVKENLKFPGQWLNGIHKNSKLVVYS